MLKDLIRILMFTKTLNWLCIFLKFSEFLLCIFVWLSKLFTVIIIVIKSWRKRRRYISILTFIILTANIYTWMEHCFFFSFFFFANAPAFTLVSVTVARHQLNKSLRRNTIASPNCHQNSIFFHPPTLNKVINSHSFR